MKYNIFFSQWEIDTYCSSHPEQVQIDFLSWKGIWLVLEEELLVLPKDIYKAFGQLMIY